MWPFLIEINQSNDLLKITVPENEGVLTSIFLNY